MSLFSLFLLALALAADSFAASIAKGTQMFRPTLRQALLVGIIFGGVQVMMPLLGWRVGLETKPVIEAFDHWFAFAVLTVIGGKMIYEGLRADSRDFYKHRAFTVSALILTAIATSIDALVVGFSFGFVNMSVLIALVMIGGVTFVSSASGVYLGRRFGKHFGEYVEIIAGVVLVLIGLKILIDHLYFQ